VSGTTTIGALRRRVESVAGGAGVVDVGVFLDGRGGTRPYEGSDLSVLEVAIIQHMGLGVPARPFMTRAMRDLRGEISAVFGAAFQRFWAGRISHAELQRTCGVWLVRAIRKWILDHGELWPNAPATVQAKGSSVPLQDSGELLAAIEWRAEGTLR
jgi:hypothetical protein